MKLELATLAIGLLCLVVAVGAYDWRLGLALFGLALIAAASLDAPWRGR